MADEAGVKLGGEFYSYDTRVKPTDSRLIRDVTGLSFREWAEALNGGDFEGVLGLTAVSVARSHPEWRRDDVVRYLEQFDMEQFEEVLPAKTEVKEEDPPAVGEAVSETVSSTQSNGSNSTPGSPSEASTRRSIGTPA